MSVQVVVEGRFACFTIPAFVTERVSYELPPPPAARGMLEAILWKPEFRYIVRSVAMVRHSSGEPTRFITVMTNEVKRGDCVVEEQRTQRRSNILRFPAFLIEVGFAPGARLLTKPGHNMQTYMECFKRRVRKGQSFHTPYLGQREYPADVRMASKADVPLDETRPLGAFSYTAWSPANYVEQATDGVRVVQPAVEMVAGRVDMSGWMQ